MEAEQSSGVGLSMNASTVDPMEDVHCRESAHLLSCFFSQLFHPYSS